MTPQRLPASPRVALTAWSVPSESTPGVAYAVALMVPRESWERPWWSSECPSAVYREKRCKHVERVQRLLRALASVVRFNMQRRSA